MRVLHLSTFDIQGGAARSAWRLHEGLRAAGVDSAMLVRRKKSGDDSALLAPGLGTWRWRFWNFAADQLIARQRTAVSDTLFTLAHPGHAVADLPAVREADVLHLHWVAQFLSPSSIAALAGLGKPMVWTLHDMRPFTGGCHFAAGCQGYTRDCAGCPQLARDPLGLAPRALSAMCRAVDDARLTVVAPSRWLADCARASTVFRGVPVEVIPYSVPPDFRPMEKADARRQLGLPADAPLVLFGADAASERRKGFAEMLAAVRLLLPRHPALRLVCFGPLSAEVGDLAERVIRLGYLDTAEKLRAAYAAADVFALPSLEDNLPNTMLEALACGTPVAAFPAGGALDFISDATGCMAADFSPASLADAIATVLADSAARGANAAKLASARLAPSLQAAAYRALYACGK